MSEDQKKSMLHEAERLERSGRYETAAVHYDMIAEIFKDEKFYDKSRELRDKARGLQVNVNYTDFNEFIRQLKESGGTVAYRCGKCGADLKIDGKSTGKCDYCGSELAILPELIKAMPLTLK